MLVTVDATESEGRRNDGIAEGLKKLLITSQDWLGSPYISKVRNDDGEDLGLPRKRKKGSFDTSSSLEKPKACLNRRVHCAAAGNPRRRKMCTGCEENTVWTSDQVRSALDQTGPDPSARRGG